MLKTKKEILGRHIIFEISECNNEKLSDLRSVKQIMLEAALFTEKEAKELIFHQISPQELIGVVVMRESYLIIHTCPEMRYAVIDLFTATKNVNPFSTADFIKRKFEAKRTEIEEVERGNLKENKLSSLIHFC